MVGAPPLLGNPLKGPQLVTCTLAQVLPSKADGDPDIMIFRGTDRTLQLVVSFAEPLSWTEQVAAICRRLMAG